MINAWPNSQIFFVREKLSLRSYVQNIIKNQVLMIKIKDVNQNAHEQNTLKTTIHQYSNKSLPVQ